MQGVLAGKLAIVVAVVLLGVVAVEAGEAQEASATRVEVRVWQDVRDERAIYISARPAEGSWRTLRTVPLPLDEGVSSTGRFRYGDIALDVPVADWASPWTVQVRVWQDVRNDRNIHVSARPEGGLWRTLGTIPLSLDDGLDSSGRFRFGDISLDVPLTGVAVTTLAGSPGSWGYLDGSGTRARFGGYSGSGNLGLAVARDGSVVVADYWNHAIRRVALDGTVTTIAGARGRGPEDGPVEIARFTYPSDVAVAGDGAIYVADSGNNRIRKISPDGIVSTVAGSDRSGDEAREMRDGPALQALLDGPRRLALDVYGDLYITERYAVRRLSPSGWVSTFAGGNGHGRRDGPKEEAQFQGLWDIAVDDAGNLYLVDDNRGSIHARGAAFTIRKIDAAGMVTTLYQGPYPALGGTLASPSGLAATGSGLVYVANTGRHQIVTLTPEGELRAIAGTGEQGHVHGPLGSARFSAPEGLALSPEGDLVVADHNGSVIRRVLLEGSALESGEIPLADFEELPRVAGVRVSVFAGRGGQGFVDGPADQARFSLYGHIAMDQGGNIIVADTNNHAIRRIASDGTVTTIAGGNGPGILDGPCEEAQFNYPQGVAVDENDLIYVSERNSDRVRRIDAGCSVKTVTDAAPGLHEPHALAFDREGNLLVAHYRALRRLSPDGRGTTIATLQSLRGIAIDEEGTIFLSGGGNAIRRLDHDGRVSTVVGTPGHRFGGAFSSFLFDVAVGPGGELYVADGGYDRVLRVTRDGTISVVADGIGANSLLVAPDGSLFVADGNESVIVKIAFEDDQGDE
ncbi:MAG: hypothetical protein OXS47_06090 [Chloroflexota bacterium]|nr:hypothetical protein [Chloroflexota bacterium]